MQRTERYESTHERRGTFAKDAEAWLANSLATLLAALAITGGVIGIFVAFGYLANPEGMTDFQAGMVWFVGSIILAISANVFRREHHVVEPDERMKRVDYER